MIYFISIISNRSFLFTKSPSPLSFNLSLSLSFLISLPSCFFNIYLNICCSFRFHFSSVTFEWFKLDGCLCIHFFPAHLMLRMKSFHATPFLLFPLPLPLPLITMLLQHSKIKRQKSRIKRKTFVKKIWIWNENMVEMNWNRNGLSGPKVACARPNIDKNANSLYFPSLPHRTQCCK